uniref:Putative ankyrin repeat-containing protein n=2 Tax=Ixodes ricinus TaxID=34613 RepID=V5HC01_IXORI
MKNNPAQSQMQKAVSSPDSSRLTLRFQSVRSRDDKGPSRSHSPVSAPTAAPKYPLYCVSMEAQGRDTYDLNGKKEEPSTTAAGGSALVDVVSSSSPAISGEEQTPVSTGETLNGSLAEPHCDEVASDEPLRKRRRSSNDSNNGISTGKARPSRGEKAHSRGPEAESNFGGPRKRGGNSSSDTESGPSEQEMDTDQALATQEASCGSSSGNGHGSSPKVPPLKIVLPPSGVGGLEAGEPVSGACSKERKVSSTKPALPYVVNSTEPVGEGSPEQGGGEAGERRREEERCQRVTRSSHRAALTHDDDATEEGASTEVHPRKRKLRAREEHHPGSLPAPSGLPPQPPQPAPLGEDGLQPVANGFQMFLDIRRQVEKRRQAMAIVHPKPPQGFKDYLLNRGSYVLEGNPSSRLSVPVISLPQSLSGSPMKELFGEQEQERYKLRLQHLIEREKLVLSAEQEILRVHGRAARAIQNQAVPLSACSILRDEEIYNVLKPEQICIKSPESLPEKKDDKDKNVRSRYNGRLFLSWLQDVEDKWEKTKEKMLLRQHNEAESLHAVQKLDWEWKLKELGLCDVKATPIIDDICVPSVHVSDEFDVLPA